MSSGAARAVVLALTLLSGMTSAQAADSVSIRTFPGYPLPGQSIGKADVRIERLYTSPDARDQEIDRFFSRVEATLTELGIARDWQMVIPDAPSIEITVELSGRRTRLASAHVSLERNEKVVVTERGAEALNGRTRDAVLSQRSEATRQHRLAFERLLELSLERARALLAR